MSTAEEKQQLGSPALDRSGALESPLPPAILRGCVQQHGYCIDLMCMSRLGDRSYDKRKNAALDLTGLIKNYQVSISDPLQGV